MDDDCAGAAAFFEDLGDLVSIECPFVLDPVQVEAYGGESAFLLSLAVAKPGFYFGFRGWNTSGSDQRGPHFLGKLADFGVAWEKGKLLDGFILRVKTT